MSSLDAKKRPCKKERPCIKSCFHRGYVPHEDRVYKVLRVKNRGKLFGKEVSSI
jgi:predicted methyltransferase